MNMKINIDKYAYACYRAPDNTEVHMDTPSFRVERMYRTTGEASTKAFADVSIDGAVVVKGLRVVQGSKGLFVGMPRKPGKDGSWYDTVRPLTKEARASLVSTVLEAFGHPNEAAGVAEGAGVGSDD